MGCDHLWGDMSQPCVQGGLAVTCRGYLLGRELAVGSVGPEVCVYAVAPAARLGQPMGATRGAAAKNGQKRIKCFRDPRQAPFHEVYISLLMN